MESGVVWGVGGGALCRCRPSFRPDCRGIFYVEGSAVKTALFPATSALKQQAAVGNNAPLIQHSFGTEIEGLWAFPVPETPPVKTLLSRRLGNNICESGDDSASIVVTFNYQDSRKRVCITYVVTNDATDEDSSDATPGTAASSGPKTKPERQRYQAHTLMEVEPPINDGDTEAVVVDLVQMAVNSEGRLLLCLKKSSRTSSEDEPPILEVRLIDLEEMLRRVDDSVISLDNFASMGRALWSKQLDHHRISLSYLDFEGSVVALLFRRKSDPEATVRNPKRFRRFNRDGNTAFAADPQQPDDEVAIIRIAPEALQSIVQFPLELGAVPTLVKLSQDQTMLCVAHFTGRLSWYNIKELEEKHARPLNSAKQHERSGKDKLGLVAPDIVAAFASAHWHDHSLSALDFSPYSESCFSAGEKGILNAWNMHGNFAQERSAYKTYGGPILLIVAAPIYLQFRNPSGFSKIQNYVVVTMAANYILLVDTAGGRDNRLLLVKGLQLACVPPEIYSKTRAHQLRVRCGLAFRKSLEAGKVERFADLDEQARLKVTPLSKEAALPGSINRLSEAFPTRYMVTREFYRSRDFNAHLLDCGDIDIMFPSTSAVKATKTNLPANGSPISWLRLRQRAEWSRQGSHRWQSFWRTRLVYMTEDANCIVLYEEQFCEGMLPRMRLTFRLKSTDGCGYDNVCRLDVASDVTDIFRIPHEKLLLIATTHWTGHISVYRFVRSDGVVTFTRDCRKRVSADAIRKGEAVAKDGKIFVVLWSDFTMTMLSMSKIDHRRRCPIKFTEISGNLGVPRVGKDFRHEAVLQQPRGKRDEFYPLHTNIPAATYSSKLGALVVLVVPSAPSAGFFMALVQKLDGGRKKDNDCTSDAGKATEQEHISIPLEEGEHIVDAQILKKGGFVFLTRNNRMGMHFLRRYEWKVKKEGTNKNKEPLSSALSTKYEFVPTAVQEINGPFKPCWLASDGSSQRIMAFDGSSQYGVFSL